MTEYKPVLVHFSRIKSDRQVKLTCAATTFTGNFSRIKSDRQVKPTERRNRFLTYFSRIKSDRQVKRNASCCLACIHFSRIKSNKQAKKAKRFYGTQSRQKALRLSAILHGLHNTGVCG